MPRTVVCADGGRWEVRVATRPSAYRLDLVFASLDAPDVRYRSEVEGGDLAAFSDEELCWILEQATRAAGGGSP
ncbi:MAG: hypothetical protein HY702_05000 [Gemmatimonadetes bacterium]|nr:hypothetical protein [Gemmatimonadota bacterium]